MERSFSVTDRGKPVGKVLVQRHGLYYHFSCRCSLSGDIMYRLLVTCGNHQEDLGILVPKEESFVLHTRIPVKRIGEGDMAFTLVTKHEAPSGTFVPICPEEPFTYLARLKQSFLVQRDGQPGIFIQKVQEY